jgi:general control protein GCN4
MDLYDHYQSFEMDGATDSSFQVAYNSPAVPTTYDLNMVRTNSSSTNVGTVSPQDLMVRDPSFSAPNSTAFTNWTSPSDYHVSPGFNEFESSPLFNNDSLDGPASNERWPSLFPDSNATDWSPVDQSPLEPHEELVVSEHLRNNSQHRRSGSSPGTNKASSSSGVSARKRNQPLPPIVIEDPNDTVAMKRARNTLAARKSQQKKMERFDGLENEIAELKRDRDHWKALALARNIAQE